MEFQLKSFGLYVEESLLVQREDTADMEQLSKYIKRVK